MAQKQRLLACLDGDTQHAGRIRKEYPGFLENALQKIRKDMINLERVERGFRKNEGDISYGPYKFGWGGGEWFVIYVPLVGLSLWG